MKPANAHPDSSSDHTPQWFATTHWTVVRNAADNLSPRSAEALETLCRNYWHPLYAFVRCKGYDSETAKDLTQEFFGRLLAKQLLHGVDPAKGRFRSWLLGVMKHFLAHEWTREKAQKRGGGREHFSLDELDSEDVDDFGLATASDSEAVFDRQWAWTVLEHAGRRLRTEYDSSNKAEQFGILKTFLSPDQSAINYEEAAKRLCLSENGLKTAIHRLRRRYQELLREEISKTVTTPGEIDDEIRYLLEIIRK